MSKITIYPDARNNVTGLQQMGEGPTRKLAFTHRTAISNDRVLRVDYKTVTFSWKDYSQNNKQ
ncbi:MAG: hypothetical protein B6D64_08690 [Bacteroidetes bacterium 4484_276]|nr:MAG: hypothetical protein B6D64_08690 [Bacteroidetes bacterium 4484_276]